MAKSKSRTRKRPTNATTNPAVEAGIKLIEEFYALGTTPTGKTPSSPLLNGTTELTRKDYTEKARRFADPKKGYTSAERVELIAQCRKSNFIIGHSHVLILLRINDRAKRRAIQKEMAEKHWGQRKLIAHIKQQIGNPNSYAGKNARKPVDEKDALNSVTEASNHFVRVLRAAVAAVAEKHEKAMPGQGLARLLCQHIGMITAALVGGDPPPPSISAQMRNRVKQIRTQASGE